MGKDMAKIHFIIRITAKNVDNLLCKVRFSLIFAKMYLKLHFSFEFYRTAIIRKFYLNLLMVISMFKIPNNTFPLLNQSNLFDSSSQKIANLLKRTFHYASQMKNIDL